MLSRWPAKIREIMRNEEDGITVNELAHRLTAKRNSIASALEAMPDTYIDRWTDAGQSMPYEAIWSIVIPPENCPQPRKPKPLVVKK